MIETKGAQTVADFDVHRGSDDAMDPYIYAGVGQNAKEVWIQPVDEHWIKALDFLFITRRQSVWRRIITYLRSQMLL